MTRRQVSLCAAGMAALRARIGVWRRNAEGICPRMPEELWDEVITFAVENGPRAAAQALEVSYSSLTRRLSRAPKSKSASATPTATFVQLGLPPVVEAGRPDEGVAIEFTRAGGERLRIELPSNASAEVVNVARLWLKAELG